MCRTSVLSKDASYISDVTYADSGNVETASSGGKTVQYTYDAIERQTKRRVVIDEDAEKYLDITYAYRDSSRGSGYTTNQLAAERVGGVRYAYEYDRNGNITSINRTNSSNNGKVIYTYDSHDQLIREDNPISGISTSYEYDASGNLKKKIQKSYADGTVGETISTDAYNYGSAISGDRLTKINNEAITYDGIGNPNNMDGWTLTWNGRRLASMTKGNDTITFGYNAEGKRISKTVNGAKTRYFYIGDTVAGEESAANGKIAYIYDDAGRISALRRTFNGTTTTYHLLTNSRGDVEAIYKSDGTLIARYIYDAYGNEIKREYGETESHRAMADINPFRYRGYMYDREMDLYYCSYRYYNSDIGRFISPDSTDYINAKDIDRTNLYAYCSNNPVNNTDPTGNAFLSTLLLSIAYGVVSGAVSGAVTAAMNGQDVALGAAHGAFWGGMQGALGGIFSGIAKSAKTAINIGRFAAKSLLMAGVSACEDYNRQAIIEKRETIDNKSIALAAGMGLVSETAGLVLDKSKPLLGIEEKGLDNITFNVISNPLTDIMTFAGGNDISKTDFFSNNKNNIDDDKYH